MAAGISMMIALPCVADNSACWGDDSRTDITCVKITEPFILGLRGQSLEAVQKVFGALGRNLPNAFHFISNYDRGRTPGSGTVNVRFTEGRATGIYGEVETGGGHFKDFVWSAYAAPPLGADIDRTSLRFDRPPVCSDVTGHPTTCAAGNGRRQLIIYQMQLDLSQSELREEVERICSIPNGDAANECPQLRRLFR
jgi:hypothetical protein